MYKNRNFFGTSGPGWNDLSESPQPAATFETEGNGGGC